MVKTFLPPAHQACLVLLKFLHHFWGMNEPTWATFCC